MHYTFARLYNIVVWLCAQTNTLQFTIQMAYEYQWIYIHKAKGIDVHISLDKQNNNQNKQFIVSELAYC